jgi:hypothetical protein
MRMGGRNEDVGRVSQHRPPPPQKREEMKMVENFYGMKKR